MAPQLPFYIRGLLWRPPAVSTLNQLFFLHIGMFWHFRWLIVIFCPWCQKVCDRPEITCAMDLTHSRHWLVPHIPHSGITEIQEPRRFKIICCLLLSKLTFYSNSLWTQITVFIQYFEDQLWFIFSSLSGTSHLEGYINYIWFCVLFWNKLLHSYLNWICFACAESHDILFLFFSHIIYFLIGV